MNITIVNKKNVFNTLFRYFLMSLVSIISASAQTTDISAKYHIRYMGMTIGEFSVNQKKTGEDISIEATTDVKVKMILTHNIKYIQQSLYRQGVLLKYQVQTLKNGKIDSDTRLEKAGNTYILTKDGDSTLIHDKITYSGSLLYFNEPKEVSVVYKERSGEKQFINRIADNTYVVTDDRNRKINEYKYRDGILEYAEFEHPLATIYFSRFL